MPRYLLYYSQMTLYLCICHVANWWMYRDKFRQFLIKVNSKFHNESNYESVLHVYTLRNHRILYTLIQIAFYFAYNLLVCSEFEEYWSKHGIRPVQRVGETVWWRQIQHEIYAWCQWTDTETRSASFTVVKPNILDSKVLRQTYEEFRYFACWKNNNLFGPINFFYFLLVYCKIIVLKCDK